MKIEELYQNGKSFYIEPNGDIKTFVGTHKDYFSSMYRSWLVGHRVFGICKDKELYVFQGNDFQVPTISYDLNSILGFFGKTKKDMDFVAIGLTCDENENYTPIETITIGDTFKYISYMITIGGDAGWRFSNHSEWCSCEHRLLFDSEKWTMEAIANEMKILYRAYRRTHGSTFAEKYDNGIDAIRGLISRDGVYVWGSGLGAPEDKQLEPAFDEVDSWCMNGSTRNDDYDR